MARTVREKNTPAMLLSDWVSLNSLPGCYAPGPFLLGHRVQVLKGDCPAPRRGGFFFLLIFDLKTSLSLCNRHSFLVLPCDLHYNSLNTYNNNNNNLINHDAFHRCSVRPLCRPGCCRLRVRLTYFCCSGFFCLSRPCPAVSV